MIRPVRTQNMGVTRSAIAFRDENERRKTFEGFWSDTWPVSPKALAQAGFYYCGPDDMVQCAWCYGKLQGWEQGDNPLREHAKHFASCPKFGDRKADNASSLVNIHHTQEDLLPNNLSGDDLGILTVRPSNPQFAIEALRLESFKSSWPTNLTQTPENLSSAGFFYDGYSDNVKCFFCDGGLCNWESEDDPWTEHARWFPNCGFLKQVRGSKYIQKVQDIGVNGGPVTLGNEGFQGMTSSNYENHVATWTNKHSPSRSITMDQKREVRASISSTSVVKALEAIEMAKTNKLLAGDGHFPDDEALIGASLFANDQLMTQSPYSEALGETTPTISKNYAVAKRNNSSPSRGLTMDQKREVRAAMSSPSVVKALEAGISKEAIEMGIKNRLLAGNGHFWDDDSLIDASLLVNDQLMVQSPSSEATNVGSSKTYNDKKQDKKQKKRWKNKDSPPPDHIKESEKLAISPEVQTTLKLHSSDGGDLNKADIKSLKEENLKLIEQRLCKICMDKEVSIVFLPCGHLMSCGKCSPALRNCPICRLAIKGSVKTFMA